MFQTCCYWSSLQKLNHWKTNEEVLNLTTRWHKRAQQLIDSSRSVKKSFVDTQHVSTTLPTSCNLTDFITPVINTVTDNNDDTEILSHQYQKMIYNQYPPTPPPHTPKKEDSRKPQTWVFLLFSFVSIFLIFTEVLLFVCYLEHKIQRGGHFYFVNKVEEKAVSPIFKNTSVSM